MSEPVSLHYRPEAGTYIVTYGDGTENEYDSSDVLGIEYLGDALQVARHLVAHCVPLEAKEPSRG